jgi:hypothetical protein
MSKCEYTGEECEYADSDEGYSECMAVFIEQCPIEEG